MSNKPIIVSYKGLEVLANPDTVSKYRDGKLKMDKVLFSDQIYKDSKKGRVPSEQDLHKVFSDLEISSNDYLDHILQHGHYQMTTKERQELTDQRRRKVVTYFVNNYLDPNTGISHPPQRIEQALENIKAKIDYTIPFNKQVNEIHKKFMGVILLKKIERFTGEEVMKNQAQRTHKHQGFNQKKEKNETKNMIKNLD